MIDQNDLFQQIREINARLDKIERRSRGGIIGFINAMFTIIKFVIFCMIIGVFVVGYFYVWPIVRPLMREVEPALEQMKKTGVLIKDMTVMAGDLASLKDAIELGKKQVEQLTGMLEGVTKQIDPMVQNVAGLTDKLNDVTKNFDALSSTMGDTTKHLSTLTESMSSLTDGQSKIMDLLKNVPGLGGGTPSLGAASDATSAVPSVP